MKMKNIVKIIRYPLQNGLKISEYPCEKISEY